MNLGRDYCNLESYLYGWSQWRLFRVRWARVINVAATFITKMWRPHFVHDCAHHIFAMSTIHGLRPPSQRRSCSSSDASFRRCQSPGIKISQFKMGRILNLQTFHRGKRLLISRNYHLTRKSLSIAQFFFHPNQITFHITESGSLSFDCNKLQHLSCGVFSEAWSCTGTV